MALETSGKALPPLHIYNTLSGSKELFTPIKPGELGMYHCGPTVYDSAHIGNLRTFVFDDLVRRVFEYNGYKVTQVMNITDIDDKTIKRSVAEGLSLSDLTKKYEHKFFEDIALLNIILQRKEGHVLNATNHINDMIDLISTLIEKEYAYVADDGVYMNISKVKDYGALAKLDVSAITQERIHNDEYDKENARDFVLWKFETKDDAGNAWDASFGRGRPGWHIECSAMAKKILGPTFDIHTGGTDLIFPHHTNEIAQSECANDAPFVHYWMHGGFMNVDEVKMSKSKGNFLKLENLIEEGIDPLAFRYWLLTAHYRSQINFTFDAVKAGQAGFKGLINSLNHIETYKKEIDSTKTELSDGAAYEQKFVEAINDDINIPRGIALMFDLVKDDSIAPSHKLDLVYKFDTVFGLSLKQKVTERKQQIELLNITTAEMQQKRNEAREQKNWVLADQLRVEIDALLLPLGFKLKDREDGKSDIISL